VDSTEPGSSLYARMHPDVFLRNRTDRGCAWPTVEDIFSQGNYSGATEISFQSGTGTSTATMTVIPTPNQAFPSTHSSYNRILNVFPNCRIQLHYLCIFLNVNACSHHSWIVHTCNLHVCFNLVFRSPGLGCALTWLLGYSYPFYGNGVRGRNLIFEIVILRRSRKAQNLLWKRGMCVVT
jgi:hypothetical protein